MVYILFLEYYLFSILFLFQPTTILLDTLHSLFLLFANHTLYYSSMRSFVLLLVIAMIAAAQGQHHQWATATDNWGYDIDETADYDTLSYLVPITGYGGYNGYDVDDYEAYGGKSAPQMTFTAPVQSKLQSLSPILESLPETYANPVYTEPVVMTQLIDQPIKMPKIIRQPIVQQRVVEQPIVRTRVINQPIIRRIVTQPVVRPMVTKTTSTKPMYSEQQVVQPKIFEQNIIRQTYSEKQQQNEPIVQAATHVSGKQGGEYSTMAFYY